MKIIDLLNKIANGEEVPKKIKVRGDIFEFYERLENMFNYKQIVNGKYVDNYLCDEFFMDNKEFLNEEVGIIEEDKKIEKIKEYGIANDNKEEMCEEFLIIKQKINELIDEVNKLKEKSNE